MTLYFIIPLAIVLLAAYIFKNSADEMAYLAGCIAVVALLVALILAPWQLKLVLLSIVVLTSTKLWFPSRELKAGSSSTMLVENADSENLTTKSEKKADNSGDNFFTTLVKGSYRGVNYEHNIPAVQVSEVELKGKYRGQVWKSSQAETPAEVQPNFEIKYRGATINGQKSPKVEVEETEQEKINLGSMVQE